MAIVRWEPLRELTTLQNEMNRLFGTVFDTPRRPTAPRCAAGCRRWTWSRPTTTSCCAPTCPACRGGRQHRGRGPRRSPSPASARPSTRRQGRLPPRRARVRLVLALADAARGRRRRGRQASFDHGVLEVRIPKPEERKPRKIAIGAAPKTIEATRRDRRSEPGRRLVTPTRGRLTVGRRPCSPSAPRPGLLRPHRHAASSPTARSARPPSSRWRPRPSSRRSRCARPPSSASTWCSGTRSTCSSRPATS